MCLEAHDRWLAGATLPFLNEKRTARSRLRDSAVPIRLVIESEVWGLHHALFKSTVERYTAVPR